MKTMFLTITAAIIPFFATGGDGDSKGVEILDEGMVLIGDTQIIAVIRDGGELASRKKFTPPVRITYQIETDGDVRLGYGADQIILNWERDEKELRIDGGPVSRQHVNGGGFIPKNEKVTITQTVLANQMTISVNNVERAVWTADFSRIREQIRIFPHRSTLRVTKVFVEPIFAEKDEAKREQ